jgi:hypothetical protein
VSPPYSPIVVRIRNVRKIPYLCKLKTNIQVTIPLKLEENEDGIAGLRDMPKLSRSQTKKLMELREEL